MNKKGLIILVIIVVILICIGIYFYISNKNNKSNNEKNYEANRTATSESTRENPTSSKTSEDEKKDPPQYSEEQIATFSTSIYSKDSARQNNIQITSNVLNGTIVKSRETFSFLNTVGQATSAKGYQEAEIFDRNGNVKKGLRRW
jgi:vancomycin resistance protein YoaR